MAVHVPSELGLTRDFSSRGREPTEAARATGKRATRWLGVPLVNCTLARTREPGDRPSLRWSSVAISGAKVCSVTSFDSQELMARMLSADVARTLSAVLSPENVSRRDRHCRQPEASDLPVWSYKPMHSCEHSFLWVAGLSHLSKAAQPRTLLCVSNLTHACWWAEPSPPGVSLDKLSTQPRQPDHARRSRLARH